MSLATVLEKHRIYRQLIAGADPTQAAFCELYDAAAGVAGGDAFEVAAEKVIRRLRGFDPDPLSRDAEMWEAQRRLSDVQALVEECREIIEHEVMG